MLCCTVKPPSIPTFSHDHFLSPQSSNPSFSHYQALSLLQKCSTSNHLLQIHAHLFRTGLHRDYILITKLINLCSIHQKIDHATLVFNQIENPLTFTWNTMIRAYFKSNYPEEAILMYNLMVIHGFLPDKFTYPFVIKACVAFSSLEKGKEIHGRAIKAGMVPDIFLQNTLMELYMKCNEKTLAHKLFDKMSVKSVVSWTTMVAGLVSHGDMASARRVFDEMPERNVVSWTAMIHGYVRNNQPHEALELFILMLRANVRPNEFTIVSLLLVCTSLNSLRLGRWVHEFMAKSGFELSVYLGTALIDMYSNCGSINDAKNVFDGMSERSVATWNSMITSLGVHGKGKEALNVFGAMEKGKVRPDDITFVGVLCACVNMGLVEEGGVYFDSMYSVYGIVPTLEHCRCMVELVELGRNNDGVLVEKGIISTLC
ncbi:pentatricopeptide repeat-containing protein At3g26630, chloroplastic [Amborella trichopoda]|uniref:Pentacotripeptide-repeat region of PRORP domain-containing protein n=1 Tax=Amborella trichopoda TaxID=13333 RepID=W1PFH6_AMBTC|nr:pentatricopeptide repeat-containing protein At3g26630, chloroplastic [Amborella trichopoda]ERN06396.1 hypothetical protein AMTR_s00016p00252780 [Amborella trichopoda]|eukprot:XP_006844721.1 pentatricopeptide repeat-containing protein At3g26630, chloroplastic [Amborella trichopoda]